MSKNADVRVLIAEDDYLVTVMIRKLLQESGYTVIGQAADGLEAVEMTRLLQPDVVVMDIRMPGINGIEAARRIWAECPTPVVILTAYETPDLVQSATEAGVGAYLVKLPTSGELDRAVNVAIARFQDIMNVRRLNEELTARNEELDAFAHTVAHDLKNSLTPILRAAELVQRGAEGLPPDKLRQYMELIDRSGHKMWNIIDELLLLAEVRESDVEMEVVDMSRVVAGAQQRLSCLISDLQAQVVVPDEWPQVWGHGPWVEEIWFNYIDNALKYGGRPPRVELGAEERANGHVLFWVKDNGSGLSMEEQQLLFNPLPHPQLLQSRGSGLGLSIVRRIASKLGGNVGLESETGLGSRFWFTLPK